MYIPLSRKYRPKNFDDVIGQEHISKTLINAINSDHISHAYLFSGPRGTGKTTLARILAKAINCENENNERPCYNCSICLDDSNQDIIEIDGASNRGIDEIRNIKDNVKFAPIISKYKVYIIDEVHMLTEQAFNALLKTLEEPPNFIVFMFATTEFHKVPETILSRCQKFNVKLISFEKIEKRLEFILRNEKIKYEIDALKIISKLSSGSMRDALSLLDQVLAYSKENITINNTNFILGIINSETIFETAKNILDKNIKSLLEKISLIEENGFSFTQFLSQIRNYFRNLMLIKSGITIENSDIYNSQKDKISLNKIIKNIDIINQTMYEIKTQDFPKTSLELCLIKLAIDDYDESLENNNLTKKVNENFNLNFSNDVNKSENTSKNISMKIKNFDNLNNEKNENDLENFDEKNLNLKKINDDNLEKIENLKTNLDDKNTFLQNLNKNWDFFLTKISNEKTFLREYLINNKGIELNNKTLIFSFDTKFYADGINRNKEIIEKVLRNIFSSEISISVIFDPYIKNKNIKKIEDSKINNNENKLEDFVHEKVKKVLDIIGGELISS